jgi:hypothetical protein
MAAIAVILAIFKSLLSLSHSSCGKNPTYQFSLKLEHFEILRILAAILKMAANITVIL